MANFDKSNLQALVAQAGISVQQIATAAGISYASLRNYLHRNTVPTLDVLIKLADYFDVPLDYIVGRCDEETARAILEDYKHRSMTRSHAQLGNRYSGHATRDELSPDNYGVMPMWPYNFLEAVLSRTDDREIIAGTPLDHINMDIIMKVLDALTPREKLGILSYYRDEMSLRAVGELPEFNVSPERTRRIILKALRKLRYPSFANLLRHGNDWTEQYAELKRREREIVQKDCELTRLECELKRRAEALKAQERKLPEDHASTAIMEPYDNVQTEESMSLISIEDMDLEVRAYNCLKRAEMMNLKDVVECIKKGELMSVRNLDGKSAFYTIDKVFMLTGYDYSYLYPHLYQRYRP